MKEYNLSPLIIKAHSTQRMTLSPLGGHPGLEGKAYAVTVLPMETHTRQFCAATPQDGKLCFDVAFQGEQEYRVEILDAGVFSVYCVEADLFERQPFKGDFHIHSNRSDGKDPPAFVVAACRKIGMDFIAITDHGKYAPSLEAIEAYKGFNGGPLILPGEEVHPPGNPVHIINFGGAFSINERFENPLPEDGYGVETAHLPATVNPLHYAQCQWCFDRIEEAGGISLFCHPFWVEQGRYNVAAPLADYLFENRRFTAFELLGGHEKESNNLQAAYFQKKCGQGFHAPFVGVSDAHGCVQDQDYFGYAYTIVFCKNLSLEEIRQSLTGGYNVAVEQCPGEQPHIYGDFRFVKYALFLLRTYFIDHDRACADEAVDMLEYIKNIFGGPDEEVFNLVTGHGDGNRLPGGMLE